MSSVVEYNQPTSAPTAKVAAVGKAGAVAVIVPLIVTLLAQFGVIVPDEVTQQVITGIGLVVTLYSIVQALWQFGAGYLKKSERKV